MARSKIDRKARTQLPPVPAPRRPPDLRVQDFEELVELYAPEAARAEAARCLHCPHAPCREACPLHNDIPRALGHIEAGDVHAAAAVYRETSTLPEICGRVCPQNFCQDACVLTKMGKPIDTRHLEAFAATHSRRQGGLPRPPEAAPTGKRVAVVGAGPAGLTVAERLARKGHAVVIYEQYPEPGGLLVYGIPGYKLDREVVQAKIAWLKSLGVEFRCNTTVGADVSAETLQQAYDALFLGIGAQQSICPGLPGKELEGVYPANEFLARASLPADLLPAAWQTPLQVGSRVHVLGAGDTAMDALRTALRLPGVETATCYYRRSEVEMPAHAEDYRHAREEGADFVWLASPTAFLGDGEGRLRAVVYQRMELCEPDASGRCRPVPLPGSEFTVEAQSVVLSLGYCPDCSLTETIPGLTLGWRGTVEVLARETGETGVPGIFAAGDLVRGADLVAPAVADAWSVAEAIDAYLQA
ncbi:MAG: FAD-dependent oxidoreductase [Anaerolineales bacterium]